MKRYKEKENTVSQFLQAKVARMTSLPGMKQSKSGHHNVETVPVVTDTFDSYRGKKRALGA